MTAISASTFRTLGAVSRFDTGAVYGTEDYGRLILRYETSGQGVIDNTAPNYPNDNIAADVAKLQREVQEVRHTLYTALTSMEA